MRGIDKQLVMGIGIVLFSCFSLYGLSQASMLVNGSSFSDYSAAYYIILTFLGGVLASLTPCIYPMIPVTVGILQIQATTSVMRNFALALVYVFGMATVYALLGYMAARTSLVFGQWLANPWFLFFIVLFFLYFAFAMFGWYDVYLPSFSQKQPSIKVRGSLLYSFIFGVISGTVTSPCASPILGTLLLFVARMGEPLLGLSMLFSFACGLGMLLVVIGTFTTTLNVLPQSGRWMLEVKKIFGFLLLGTCIYFIQMALFKQYIGFVLYGLLMFAATIYYLATSVDDEIGVRSFKITGAIALLFGSMILFAQAYIAQYGVSMDQFLTYIQQERLYHR